MDGEGGEGCANFLKENLFSLIVNNLDLNDLHTNLKESCLSLDESFYQENPEDTSGSSNLSLIMLGKSRSLLTWQIDENLIFMNIGSCRAFVSKSNGEELQVCSRDHKPGSHAEMQRIFAKGGLLYRISSDKESGENEVLEAKSEEEFLSINQKAEETDDKVFGPWRIKQGDLSVSRIRPSKLNKKFSV